MRKTIIAALAVGALALSGCSGTSTAEAPESAAPEPEQSDAALAPSTDLSGDLQIYAAASLKGAFGDIIDAFSTENPNLNVLPPVYDGSSTLVTQIIEGAPADVFASADEKNMEKLTAENLEASTPEIFATNDITIAVGAGNPKGIVSLEDLAKPDVSVVICAPEVPCGAATQRLLEAENVEISAVSQEQNVTSVATKVAAGEADAGLVYITDVAVSNGDLEAVDTSTDTELTNFYPIAEVKDAPNPEAAKAFIAFVLSDAGQAILRDYGFGQK